MVTRVKVLCLPVYQRQWMWHAYSSTEELSATEGASNAKLAMQEQGGLKHRLQMLNTSVNQKFQTTISNQWAELQAAKEGTFKHWMYKLARGVLVREDPVESFMKRIPADANQLEVIYPSSLDQALVRRRLRLLSYSGAQRHRRHALGWGLFSFPQIPLVFTPFPNVTVYYCMYRAFSHYKAMNGAQTLKAAFMNEDSRKLQCLLDKSVPHNNKKKKQGVKGQSKGKSKVSATMAGSEEQLGVLLQQLQQHLEDLDHASLKNGSISSCSSGSLRSQTMDSANGAGSDNDGSGSTASSSGRGEGSTTRSSGGKRAGDQRRSPVVVFVSSCALEEAIQPLDRWRKPLEQGMAEPLLLSHGFDLAGYTELLERVRRKAGHVADSSSAPEPHGGAPGDGMPDGSHGMDQQGGQERHRGTKNQGGHSNTA